MYTTHNCSCELFWMKIKMLNRFKLCERMPVVDNVVAMRCKQTSCEDVDSRNIMQICILRKHTS